MHPSDVIPRDTLGSRSRGARQVRRDLDGGVRGADVWAWYACVVPSRCGSLLHLLQCGTIQHHLQHLLTTVNGI